MPSNLAHISCPKQSGADVNQRKPSQPEAGLPQPRHTDEANQEQDSLRQKNQRAPVHLSREEEYGQEIPKSVDPCQMEGTIHTPGRKHPKLVERNAGKVVVGPVPNIMASAHDTNGDDCSHRSCSQHNR